MKRHRLVVAVIGLVAALLVGTFVLTGPSISVQADSSNRPLSPGTGPLDGLRFVGLLGQEGKAGDIEDNLVFEDGMFISEECELRCDYPASPYYVREHDDAFEFVSESKCPRKDATIIWRGTVDGDTIKGESIWTLKRWYWTVEKKFWFEGELSTQAVATAN